MKDIKKLIEEKTKLLEEIGQKMREKDNQLKEVKREMGELQADALKLDGALNQLKELEEVKD